MQKTYLLSGDKITPLVRPNLFNTAAFRFGYGLFETTKILRKTPFFLSEHFSRLKASAQTFQFYFPISWERFQRLLPPLLKKLSSSKMYRFRIQLTPWIQSTSDLYVQPSSLMTFEITEEAPLKTGPGQKKKLTLWISSYPRDSRDPLWHHKTTSLFPKVLGFYEIHRHKVIETVFVNEKGYLCEGTASNLFILKGKTLYTPALRNGLLNGITRQKVMGLARKRSFPVVEGDFKVSFLKTAEALFITGSIKDILEIQEVKGPSLKISLRGHPWVQRFNDDFQQLMARSFPWQ